MAFRGAYGEMIPTPPATAGDIISTFMAHGLDHHWSLGYGSWKAGLQMLNHWLGVADVAVAPTQEWSGLSHHGGISQ